MAFHHCEISGCRAMLLGFDYWSFTLDDGRRVAVCPNCARKIRAARKTAARRVGVAA